MSLDRRIRIGSVVRLGNELFTFDGIVLSMSFCESKRKSDEILVWRDLNGGTASWCKKSLNWVFVRPLTIEECLTHDAKCVRLLAKKLACYCK